MYHKLTKICLKSFSARYIEVLMGRGCATLRQIWVRVCSNILFVLCIHPFLCSSQSMLGVDNHDGSLDKYALQEINSTALLCRAICIVSGDRKPPRVHLRSWCEQQKPWQWPANKAIVHVFSVYVFLNTNDDRAKTESSQKHAHLHKNIELRWGEGVRSKGTYFWGT